MSAAIAGTMSADEPEHSRPVTVTFESGHQQIVEGGGCRVLDSGQGGVVAIDTGTVTKYALFAGISCQGGRIIASGSGSAQFGTPVLAGALVLG